MKKSAVILALALSLSAWTISAQDQGGPSPTGEHPSSPEASLSKGGPPVPDGPGVRGERRSPEGPRMDGQGRDQRGPRGGSGMDGQRRPNLPIVAALDFNGDGIIDAREIAMASESLQRLDRNGDGKLTPDEYLPLRPLGQGAQRSPGLRGGDRPGGLGGPGMGGAGGPGMRGPGGKGGSGGAALRGPNGPGSEGGPAGPGNTPRGGDQNSTPPRPPSE
jgi:hypothetical protein